jgi:hypothetical protein
MRANTACVGVDLDSYDSADAGADMRASGVGIDATLQSTINATRMINMLTHAPQRCQDCDNSQISRSRECPPHG